MVSKSEWKFYGQNILNNHMIVKQYLDNMRIIYHSLLMAIEEEEENQKQSIQNLVKLLNDYKIFANINEFKVFLQILLRIVDDHHRGNNFFSVIIQILLLIKNDLKKAFSNEQILNIFIKNKLLILFLIDEKIIDMNKNIALILYYTKNKYTEYSYYFDEEINSYDDEIFDEDEIMDYYYELSGKDESYDDSNRKSGENPSHICQLIRNDSIVDFITYINKNNYSIDSTINYSIYETNSFLQKNKPTFIEYAAFFGSIQIFTYLKLNNATINPSLWLYAIHGSNPDIIHSLEEYQLKPPNDSYKECEKEAIKCHHNKIVEYIRMNFLNEENKFDNMHQIIKSYNFEYIDLECINQATFIDFVKYNYIYIVESIINQSNINSNNDDIFLLLFYKTSFNSLSQKEKNENDKNLSLHKYININYQYVLTSQFNRI